MSKGCQKDCKRIAKGLHKKCNRIDKGCQKDVKRIAKDCKRMSKGLRKDDRVRQDVNRSAKEMTILKGEFPKNSRIGKRKKLTLESI